MFFFFCIWHGIPMLSIATISKSEEFVIKICIFVHLADLQGGIECNAHTCSSPRPVCIVRQQRAHIWHSETPRCISQSGELQWRSKGRWASMLHKHPFLSLMTYSPHLNTSRLLCLYISLTVCPVNTLSSFVSIERRHLAGHRENTQERVVRIPWNRWAIFCLSPERDCFSPTHSLRHAKSLSFCFFASDWELKKLYSL